MDIFRLLFVEEDFQRAAGVATLLPGSGYEVLPVTNLSEAEEALLLQRFDGVLLGSTFSPGEVTGFCTQLRGAEARQQVSWRTPVLALRPAPVAPSQETTKPDSTVDGYLPEHFEPAQLRAMLLELTRAEGGEARSEERSAPVFEPEQFEEQCGFERELMIEIVDLFLTERAEQLPQMCEAVAMGDYENLSRIAHTIKGSLSSLHAPAARLRAQALEAAAKEQNGLLCQELLMAFDQDLEELEPHLAAFRESCVAQ